MGLAKDAVIFGELKSRDDNQRIKGNDLRKEKKRKGSVDGRSSASSSPSTSSIVHA